jgi:hypothetical protein
VSCFKPFKTTFKKVRDEVMFKSNNMEPDKIFLVGWVDHTIDQSFTKKNIKVGFKATCIWPFNPKAMDNKIRPSKIYITININNHESDKKEYTLDEKTNHN